MVNSLAGKKAKKSSMAVAVLFDEPGNRVSSAKTSSMAVAVLFNELGSRVSSVTEGALSCRPDPIASTASDNKDGVKVGATKGTSELRIPKR